MKIKDLKINFRYLAGNIACLSVDSIDGKSVHNDINDEEAIIIFNSLIGEKENCQTVKTLLKENQELKSQLAGTTFCYDEEEHRKLENNWNELKKWLYEEHYLYVPEIASNSTYQVVLNKMQELEKGCD